MASVIARRSDAGGSKSGNPCPKLSAPCSSARRDMVVKMLVPTFSSLDVRFIADLHTCVCLWIQIDVGAAANRAMSCVNASKCFEVEVALHWTDAARIGGKRANARLGP